MGRLVYAMACSVDGFVADDQGRFDWAAPDEEVHQFFNDMMRAVGTHLYGRRMYEIMQVWETDPSLAAENPVMADFAAVWSAADKVVVSSTLTSVATRRTRIVPTLDPAEIAAMKEAAPADLSVSGPTLAGAMLAAGLVDEVALVLAPVVVGGGLPVLPAGLRADLRLIEERPFDSSGMVLLRYAVD